MSEVGPLWGQNSTPSPPTGYRGTSPIRKRTPLGPYPSLLRKCTPLGPYRDTSSTRKRFSRKRTGSDPCVFLMLKKSDLPDSPPFSYLQENTDRPDSVCAKTNWAPHRLLPPENGAGEFSGRKICQHFPRKMGSRLVHIQKKCDCWAPAGRYMCVHPTRVPLGEG